MSLSQGAGVATWLARSGDDWEVRASLRTDAGSWGSPQTLSTLGLPTESPYVAAIAAYRPPPRNNVAVVAWRAYVGGHWRIQASVLKPGTQWSKPVTLSPPDGDAGKPVAHVVQWGNGEREPRVLWTYRGSGGGVSRLQFVRLDLDGVRKNPPKTVSASGREVRDLVIGDDFTAMWTEFDGSHWRLRTGDIAFLQQPGSRSTVTPAGEDVSQPTKAIGDSTSGYAWIASDGSTPRVRALLSMCDPFCLVDPRAAQAPVYVSPEGFEAQGISVQVGGTLVDERLEEHYVFFWRQYDGTHWRVATRTKPNGKPWSDVTYLSAAGVDASAPVSDSHYFYPEGYGVSVAWTEPSGSGAAIRVATTVLPGPASAPVVETLSEPGSNPVAVAMDQADTLGPGVAWVAEGSPDTIRLRGLDTQHPTSNLKRIPRLAADSVLSLQWFALDDWSQIAHFDVVQHESRWDRKGITRTMWRPQTSDTSAIKALRSGRSYCYRVTATDTLGRREPFSYDLGCTTTPVDDRALERDGTWRAGTSPGYFLGTFLESRERGAVLTLPRISVKRSFALLLGRGPGHGIVEVTVGQRSEVLDLDQKNVGRMKRWITGSRHGPVTITVLSNGKPVRVDGIFAEPPRLEPDDCGGRC
jgi:hypothetical protein